MLACVRAAAATVAARLPHVVAMSAGPASSLAHILTPQSPPGTAASWAGTTAEAQLMRGRAVVADNIVSLGEAEALVAAAEAMGFETAGVDVRASRDAAEPEKAELRPEIRDNERVVFDDHELAKALYARISGTLPATVAGPRKTELVIDSLAPRLRFYRYRTGGAFHPHVDGALTMRADDGTELQLYATVLIFLSRVDAGGETVLRG
ncbi:2OG-Fe(II) oxygenase family Oxidoreductase [Thecamonas trahens ATCC 50062]|uniref:2OG-Fe(II) oxygenase family Oxidoreductase n=1 Tax=Thecamonas trahens ATCC 50062 TaxID=461836 RepID=A0A0L0DDZ0_THETB|nr:2OG-Fe(II) oxygenase family Oxidoreductase [Thecamonas trahens ATCC 50062]KNC50552.1 2OG-Fe(II) oxygenase family Oxidoreductase [Thecamonas trahens ATCC 50062]|eukprot:XP_013762442.1 2OG-Fe(II) oxygenase family Oxidoreductase [Thecamonas trahens ATCC 50062]